MSIGAGMDKENVIYTEDYYLVWKKEGNPVTCGNEDETQGRYVKWNMPDSTYMQCLMQAYSQR